MRQTIIIAACAAAFAGTAAPAYAAHHHHWRHYRGHYYDYHAYGPTRPYLSDPAGPNPMLNFDRRNGNCVIDEGYGRTSRCD
jgi:hypothetical protein